MYFLDSTLSTVYMSIVMYKVPILTITYLAYSRHKRDPLSCHKKQLIAKVLLNYTAEKKRTFGVIGHTMS